ncbi:MAG: hypothetical protein LQ351_002172 [Letrouitia transgressa]|nr:MAG: hypothetical protein LQ351_002172 [Letrouitia transgressa]
MADAPPSFQPQADAMEGVIDPNLPSVQPHADAMEGVNESNLPSFQLQADAMEGVIDPNLPSVQPQADAMEGVIDPNLSSVQAQADAMEGVINPVSSYIESSYRYPVGDEEILNSGGSVKINLPPVSSYQNLAGGDKIFETGVPNTLTNKPANSPKPDAFGIAGSTPQSFTFTSMPFSKETPFMAQFAEAQAVHDRDLRQNLKQALKDKEQVSKDRDIWRAEAIKAHANAKKSQSDDAETRGKLAECDKARISFANALELLKKERAKLIQERDSAKSMLANLQETKSEELAWSTLQDISELADDQRQIAGMKDQQVLAALKASRARIEDLEHEAQDHKEQYQRMSDLHEAELEEERAKSKNELAHAKRQAQSNLTSRLTGLRLDIEQEHTRQMTVKNAQLQHLQGQVRSLEERLAKQGEDQSTEAAQMANAQVKLLEEKMHAYTDQIRVLDERLAEHARDQSTDGTQQRSTQDQQQKMETDSDDEEERKMQKDAEAVAQYTRIWSENQNLRQLNQQLLSEVQNLKIGMEKLKQDCVLEVVKHKSKSEQMDKKNKELGAKLHEARTKWENIYQEWTKLKPESEQLHSEVKILKNENEQLTILVQQHIHNSATVQEAEGMEVDNGPDGPGMQEWEQLHSGHENLVSQHQGLVLQYESLTSQHQGLVSQHESLLSQQQGLLSEKQKLENYIQELEQGIQSLRNVAQQKDDLEKSLDSLKNTQQEKNQLEQLLQKVTQERDDLEKSLSLLKGTEQEKIQLEQLLRQTGQEKVDLENSLISLTKVAREKNDLEESLKSLKDVEKQKNDMEGWLKKAEKQRAELKQKNNDLWASKETTETEIQSLRKEVDEFRAEQTALKQKCSILETQKAETTRALDEAQVSAKVVQDDLTTKLEKSTESVQKFRDKSKNLENGRLDFEKECKESLEQAQRESDRVSAEYKVFKEQSKKTMETERKYFQSREAAHKESSDEEIQRLNAAVEKLQSDMDKMGEKGEEVVKTVYQDTETQTMAEKAEPSTKKPIWLVMFMLAVAILLVAWGGCYGESARRERNMWLAANEVTGKAVTSLQAGGGTGTGVPGWLWNDPLLDTAAGRLYQSL